MACGSGCCGPPKDEATAPANTAPSTAPVAATNVDSGCCDETESCSEGKKSIDENDVTERTAKEACSVGCCVPAKAEPATIQLPGAAIVRPDESCQKSCCGDSSQTVDESCAPKITATAESKQGCCGDNVGKQLGECSAPKTDAKDECQKGCCGPINDEYAPEPGATMTASNVDSCHAPEAKIDDECNKGCCGSTQPTKPINTCGGGDMAKSDDHGAPKSKTDDDCGKGCCSSSNATTKPQAEKVPSCCEGKTSPCCDSSCIDRLALRECASKRSPSYRGTGKARSGADDCTGGQDGKPCNGHARTIRETYQAKLEALGCICRALLALGQESCCPPRDLAAEKKRSSIKSARSRTSIDSCCASGSSRKPSASKVRPRAKKNCRPASPKPKSGGGCADACCDKPKAPSIAGSCADSCCGAGEPVTTFESTKKPGADVNITTDLERGVTGREHVILSVSGMTCTGCETKLKRTLATVDAVKNLKTSLVLARAEFDLDLSAGSVADIVKHLERTTEFKCEKITSQGSSLDILSPGEPEDFISQPWPQGVTDIRIVDKKTLHVEFDAEVVGARDLVEKGWSTPMRLAAPRADPTLEAGGKHVRNVGLMTLLSTVLTIPVLVLSWAPIPENEIAYGSASLALATIVQVAIAGPFYPKALKSLIFSRMIEMDLLIVLSTSAAYIFSVVSFGYLVSHKPLSTGEFFETSTLLVTLIMVGRYVSALARQKAVESISIRSLQTSNATIIDSTGQEKEIDSRLLQYGDVFKVIPDSRVPTDGSVISGSSELDESMITGESKVVEKYTGSPVIAGSINGSGTISVRLTRLPGDNTISNIAGMVDEAKLSKPKIQDIADRVASYFVPVVVTLTIITFAIWIAVGVAVRRQSGSEATIQAVTYAITVLIVSCPCAIGLAVPMVIVIASGVAAERGVIFKSADSIEVAYKTSHVVFDKTGTLTQGKLGVVEEFYLAEDQKTTKELLLGLVGSIKHPVSSAIAAHLKAGGISPATVSDPKTLTGKGVEGTASGRTLRAGNSRWLGQSSDPKVETVLAQGFTALCFTVDGSLAAVFGLRDSVRPDALSTVSTLQASGIEVHVLSGDDDGAVRAVATQLGIPDVNVRSRCNPGDKQAYIQTLLSAHPPPGGRRRRRRHHHNKPKKPVVMFCGDGTNDAVALAQATIGVHMNEGTDVAKSAADVVLMRPNLAGILTAIAISRKAIHRIAFNFGWSFVYNLFAILLGSGAFVNARIPPEFAGLGELASVLPVIAAAVLLRWSKG